MKQIEESLRLYVEHRIKPGGFLQAVLSNDLFDSVARSDFENSQRLPEIIRYIYNSLPTECWGSKETVNNWLNG